MSFCHSKDYDSDYVDNAEIRRAVLESGISPTVICLRLGWPARDSTRLKRRLGAMSQQTLKPTGKRYKYFGKRINRELAADIVRAIDRDPWEFDL